MGRGDAPIVDARDIASFAVLAALATLAALAALAAVAVVALTGQAFALQGRNSGRVCVRVGLEDLESLGRKRPEESRRLRSKILEIAALK